MATVPVKTKPLHNFSLPLKWGHKNQVNANHRNRRPFETAVRDSPPPPTEGQHRLSPAEQDSDDGHDSKSELESENRKLAAGSLSAQPNGFSFYSCSSQKLEGAAAAGLEGAGSGVNGGERGKEKVCDEVEAEESLAKPWNLRPRKAFSKAAFEIGGGVTRNGEFRETAAAVVNSIPVAQQTENLPKSMRLRGFAEGHGLEKREKKKFWIALSREEIEEDVYAMTGSKPSRRPKRRPKAVQKQLDTLFPGLYLTGISADSYRLHEAPK